MGQYLPGKSTTPLSGQNFALKHQGRVSRESPYKCLPEILCHLDIKDQLEAIWIAKIREIVGEEKRVSNPIQITS